MKEPIDFQEFELAVQNDEAPLTNPGLKSTIRRNTTDTFLVNPEVMGDCDERRNWLVELYWDLVDEAWGLDKADPQPMIRAAIQLLHTLGMHRSEDTATIAFTWVIDCIDDNTYGVGQYHKRLRKLAPKMPKAYLWFKAEMKKRGINLPFVPLEPAA